MYVRRNKPEITTSDNKILNLPGDPVYLRPQAVEFLAALQQFSEKGICKWGFYTAKSRKTGAPIIRALLHEMGLRPDVIPVKGNAISFMGGQPEIMLFHQSDCLPDDEQDLYQYHGSTVAAIVFKPLEELFFKDVDINGEEVDLPFPLEWSIIMTGCRKKIVCCGQTASQLLLAYHNFS